MASAQTHTNSDDISPTLERWPDGHVLAKAFRLFEKRIVNMTVKDTDVWVITFPKSGTTWTQEMVWLLTHDLDFETARRVELRVRSPFLEYPATSGCHIKEGYEANTWMDKFENMEDGKRNIKTHLYWDRLPPPLIKSDAKAKIVYVARNPKDACLSYYHFRKRLGRYDGSETIEEFAERFLTDRVQSGPYWSHVKGFWERRHQPNILFLWFEDMKKDLSKVVDKVAAFLEVPPLNTEKKQALLEHLSFDAMKKNSSINVSEPPGSSEGGEKNGIYVRKGQVGSWKEEFSTEMAKQFDAWIEKNIVGTDLEERFKGEHDSN